jgi:hypothetical protein
MASVILNIECPSCKKEAYLEVFYKINERVAYCQYCGCFESSISKENLNIYPIPMTDFEISPSIDSLWVTERGELKTLPKK